MVLRKLGITVLLFLLFISPGRADAATEDDISKQLFCQCGCDKVLSNCDCDIQEAMTALIEQKSSQGQSEEEIIQSFVAKYGQQVLASPPKQSFNLAAWVLSSIAILGGGGAIYIALRKRVRQGSRSHHTPTRARKK